MHTYVASTQLNHSATDVFDWHLRSGAFERLSPPFAPATVVSRTGDITDNTAIVVLRTGVIGPLHSTWKIRHDSFVPGTSFRDVMEKGPFALWEHEHRVAPNGATASTLTDSVHYALPLGGAGIGNSIARSTLEQVFAYRHALTSGDLDAHARAAGLAGYVPKARIVVAGASGLIGSQLVAYLRTAGHTVVELVRRTPRSDLEVQWNPATGVLDAHALAGAHAVINLAGAPIAKPPPASRWTAARKQAILKSRISTTSLLAHTMATLGADAPKVFVSTSASGWYGDRGDAELSEDTGAGDGFLADVCKQWEAAAQPAREAGIRVVHPRLGIVLTPAGGALKPLLMPTKLGLGGPLGNGAQYWPWVALDDVLGAIEHALFEPSMHGPANIAAPQALPMKAVAKTLARVLRRPSVFPAPAFAMRTLLGTGPANELLLASARMIPSALTAAGYEFRHPTLEPALRYMLGKNRLSSR